MAELSHPNLVRLLMISLNGRLSVSSTRTVRRGRKTKVEYLLTFCGYGPEHNVWQEDVENCEQLVKDCWASKPASERLVVALFPPTCAHGRY